MSRQSSWLHGPSSWIKGSSTFGFHPRVPHYTALFLFLNEPANNPSLLERTFQILSGLDVSFHSVILSLEKLGDWNYNNTPLQGAPRAKKCVDEQCEKLSI